VSKNVAVFVDVANIFYAAKAAGADIDYVTLLKSAVAGRDFVRAYAYTGLDPENENQRQFHAFLARSGYKVVSKDIRKYGDGRIKANLDIELVVDLMRTARNLDIAVVVSGDGDFAPAIRAVQQQGVRVEVISFRGNTSSDLIEVADQFIDIAQIARVDKDSARSGRRVAAEGDLSMTEVPEKETEGAPRRRRGGRGRDQEREERAVAAESAAAAGGLTVLPGERLSRVGAPAGDGEADLIIDEEADLGDGILPGDELADAHRRRRRRGGRGRGRGRRPEGEGLPGEVGAGVGEDEEDFEAVLPPPPPHQSFGSVWDSQLGVPGSVTPAASAGGPVIESFLPEEGDEDLEEPEIPEYLLAERRQRPGGQRGRMGGGGRGRGAYQAALDRERFGRGAPAPSGFGANAGRPSDRPRPDRGRGGRPPRQDRPQFDRPVQQQRPPERQPTSAGFGSDPWSEVPPDLEEMLRAELARKTSTAAPSMTPIDAPPTRTAPTEPARAAAKRGRPRKAAEPVSGDATAQAAPADVDAAKPKRTTRSRTAKPADDGAEATPTAATAKPARKPRTTKAAAAPTDEAAAKPKRTTRSRTAKPAEPTAE
jgi:uncharacterized LabA/DUF88 family protein